MKYRLWDKQAKCMETFYQLRIAPNGQIYVGGANVTSRYEQSFSSGLIDVNGKEIYEGDIISIVDSLGAHMCVVKFLNGSFGSVEVGEGDEDCVPLYEDIDSFPHTIIGNIYENQDLLIS